MSVDRRTALAGMIGGAALGAIPVRAAAAAGARIVISDSRLAAGRAFLAPHADKRRIDIAAAHGDLWREVRAIAPRGASVAGLTRWSDWIGVRGVLLEKGLRVRAERAVAGTAPLGGTLIAWEMA